MILQRIQKLERGEVMKISYAITVCNEHKEIEKLLTFLLTYLLSKEIIYKKSVFVVFLLISIKL